MRKNHGFTLIELLIVITIIGILTVLGARQFGNAVNRANATADVANAQTLANALRQAVLMGDITADVAANTALVTTSPGISDYFGSSLPVVKIDGDYTWIYGIDYDNQAVSVGINDGTNNHILSPRPASLASTVWANAQ